MAEFKSNYLEQEFRTNVRNDVSIFDFILNEVLDGVIYWDLENPNQYWMNSNYWKSIGYSTFNRPKIPEEWHLVVHPDDILLSQELLIKHFENPLIPYDQTIRVFHSNGRIVWRRCRGQASTDKNGKLTRMIIAYFKASSLIYKEEEIKSLNPTDSFSLTKALKNDEFNSLQSKKATNLFNQNEIESIEKKEQFFQHEKTKVNSAGLPFFKSEKLVKLINNEPFGRRKISSSVSPISSQFELQNQIKTRGYLLDYFKNNSKDCLLIFNNNLEPIYINESVGDLIGVNFVEFPVSLAENSKFFS